MCTIEQQSILNLIDGSCKWALLAKHSHAHDTQPYVYAGLLVQTSVVYSCVGDLSCKLCIICFFQPCNNAVSHS